MDGVPVWVRVVGGLLIAGALYWAFSGEFWTPWDESNFKAACEESGLPGPTCVCVLDFVKGSGLTPNDVEGEGYDRDALGAAFACF
jgi:hypothetical protein